MGGPKTNMGIIVRLPLFSALTMGMWQWQKTKTMTSVISFPYVHQLEHTALSKCALQPYYCATESTRLLDSSTTFPTQYSVTIVPHPRLSARDITHPTLKT